MCVSEAHATRFVSAFSQPNSAGIGTSRREATQRHPASRTSTTDVRIRLRIQGALAFWSRGEASGEIRERFEASESHSTRPNGV